MSDFLKRRLEVFSCLHTSSDPSTMLLPQLLGTEPSRPSELPSHRHKAPAHTLQPDNVKFSGSELSSQQLCLRCLEGLTIYVLHAQQPLSS